MKNFLLAFTAVITAAGCGGTMLPEPMDKTKMMGGDPTTYPSGPYGHDVGSVVRDFSVFGRRDTAFNGQSADNPPGPIFAHDYFNDKSIKVLVVAVAAGWCGPCRDEQHGMIQLYNDYVKAGTGVRFLEAVVETERQGDPSTMDYVDSNWVTNGGAGWYEDPNDPIAGEYVNFDIAIDGDGRSLSEFYQIQSIPAQIVITTTEVKIGNKTYPAMSIVTKNNGVDRSLGKKIKSVLDAAK